MKVKNRSTSVVSYTVPDLNIKRSFVAGEIKEIPQQELAILIQQPGGRVILTEYLQVSKDDIKQLDVMEPEQEYFYSEEDVKEIMLHGSQDEFLDMLDFAPEGVMDMIKTFSTKLPLSDIHKIEALKKKTGFDCAKALENLRDEEGELQVANTPKRRVTVTEENSGRRVTESKYKRIDN